MAASIHSLLSAPNKSNLRKTFGKVPLLVIIIDYRL